MAIRISAWAPDQLQNLSRLRVPPEGLLGEHEVAVHLDFEDAAGGRDEPDVGVGYFLLQLSRQTGGSRLVVSDDAVLDDHAHVCLLMDRGRERRNRSGPVG
jgi:hypothetical protein